MSIDVIDVPHPTFTNLLLTGRYVVLHNGCGSKKRGEVVTGTDFFADDNQIITIARKVLNRNTGLFEHQVVDEHRMGEVERVEAIRRLLGLGAIRVATVLEFDQAMVELPELMGPAQVQTEDDKQRRIRELEAQVAELQRGSAPGPAAAAPNAGSPQANAGSPQGVTLTPAGIMLTTEMTPTGVPVQPCPGGANAQRKGKVME